MAANQTPLMPKATAVWLVDNTALSFEQIADFCGLHPLEVKGIADEDVAKGIKGQDPVASGQLTREQIADAEKDPKKRLKMAPPKHKMPGVRQKRAPRYTPVSKRQDKPDAHDLVRGWLQAEPARKLPNLAKVPILILVAEASYHAAYDHVTSLYLTQAGVPNDFVRLPDIGIRGNGHMMMLEENNLEIAAVLHEWVAKRLAA